MVKESLSDKRIWRIDVNGIINSFKSHAIILGKKEAVKRLGEDIRFPTEEEEKYIKKYGFLAFIGMKIENSPTAIYLIYQLIPQAKNYQCDKGKKITCHKDR